MAGFGVNIIDPIEQIALADPQVQAVVQRIKSDPSLAKALFAELHTRIGKIDADVSGGLLEKFQKGIAAAQPPDGVNLGMVCRLIVKKDGAKTTIPLAIYYDQLQAEGMDPVVSKFIAPVKTFDPTYDNEIVEDLNRATQAYCDLRKAVKKIAVENLMSLPEFKGRTTEAIAMDIMKSAHKRTEKLKLKAYLFLRHVKLNPTYQIPTMGISVDDRAKAKGDDYQVGDLLNGGRNAAPAPEPSYIPPTNGPKKSLGGGPTAKPDDAQFTGKYYKCNLYYNPKFTVNCLYEGISDEIVNPLVARVLSEIFPELEEAGYEYLHARTDDTNAIDAIAGVLIHEAFHTLHGHNSPLAYEYDKLDAAQGDVFSRLVNAVGDSLINQEILDTTEIKVLPYGGIIRNWDVNAWIDPAKLYHETVEKTGMLDDRIDVIARAQIIDLYNECKAEGVTRVAALFTFAWPPVQKQDFKFFQLTKWVIRHIAAQATVDNRSLYDKMKDLLANATKQAQEAIEAQGRQTARTPAPVLSDDLADLISKIGTDPYAHLGESVALVVPEVDDFVERMRGIGRTRLFD